MKPFETFFALLGALLFVGFCVTFAYAGVGPRDIGFGLLPIADHVAAAPAPFSIAIPLGAWFIAMLKALAPAATTLASGLFAFYAPPLAKLFVGKDAIARAVEVAIAGAAGAARGQKLTVTTTNAVAAEALEYIVANEPLAFKWFEKTLGQRIIAYLATVCELPAEAIAPPKLAA